MINRIPPIHTLLELSNISDSVPDWLIMTPLSVEQLSIPRSDDSQTCPASPTDDRSFNTGHNTMSIQILAPKRKREKQREAFTSIDDKLLLIAVAKHGCNWTAVSLEMGRFTSRQCRERYMNYLNPNLKMVGKPWTPEENSLLIHLYSINGPKWRFISNYFKGRSYNEVRNHCVRLQKNGLRA